MPRSFTAWPRTRRAASGPPLLPACRETLTVCGHELRAGFIGSVSVHPRARGEGFMKRLMADWDAEMQETLADLAVLSGQRQRYEYFGYTSGGLKLQWTVNDANVRHALRSVDDRSFSFRPLAESPEALALAQELHLRQPARVYRAPALFEETLRTFGMRPLAVLKKGKAAGYLAAPRRTARSSMRSHWMATRISARRSRRFLPATGPAMPRLPHPPRTRLSNRRLETFAESWRLEASEMIRIYRFAPVLEAYLTLRQKTLGLVPGEWSAVLGGQPVTVRVTGAGVTVGGEGGPRRAGARIRSRRSRCCSRRRAAWQDGLAPAGWFPLPIFWPTADQF